MRASTARPRTEERRRYIASVIMEPIQRLEFIDVAAQILTDPGVAHRIRDDVGDAAYREILERGRSREAVTVDGCDLESYVTVDPLEGDLYHEFTVKGDDNGVIDDWSIKVRGFGGIYFWTGGDFEVAGCFTSLTDALGAVRADASDVLVSKKGRKHRKTY